MIATTLAVAAMLCCGLLLMLGETKLERVTGVVAAVALAVAWSVTR